MPELRPIARWPLFPFATSLLTLAGSAGAQNLLENGGFENGLANWTTASSSAQVLSYGASGVPSLQVSNAIGGGNRLVRDLGGNATVLTQAINTGPIGAGLIVEASGYFGGLGSSSDYATLVVIFQDAASAEIARRSVQTVSAQARNGEDVLMFRRGRFAVPTGTERLVARLELANPCCGGATALADEIFLGLTSDPIVPPPLPIAQELLVNGAFEQGWSQGSPLSLTEAGGWEGLGGTSRVRFYSNSDPFLPSLTVAGAVDGGASLLVDESAGSLRQLLDVRGNAAQIASGIDLAVSAFEGGWATSDDTARVEVRFFNEFFVAVGAPPMPVGPVTRAMRNGETVVMKREERYTVPNGTAYISIDVVLENPCCGGANAMVDNVSAQLVPQSAPAPLPLLVNLVRNGSFEGGSIPGSPLQLDQPDSWTGTTNGRVIVTSYGANGNVPSTAFSQSNGLGGLVLGDLTGDGGALQQSFDLGGMQDLINQGSLMVSGSIWLGGAGAVVDYASARIRFRNSAGVQIGFLEELGPVTAADRANQTTLLREADSFVVPLGTASLEIRVEMTNFCCGAIAALIDGVELFLSDGSTFGTSYCSANPNSTGASATIAAIGSDVVAMNSMTLAAGGLPPFAFAFFITSPVDDFVANPAGSSGNLCLGGSIGRYVGPNQIRQANGVGNIALGIDLQSIPTPNGPVSGNPGETRFFQAWYRDSAAGGSTSNFTNGVEVLLR